MAKRKRDFKKVIEALQASNGLQAGAARALNVSRQTIANYIKTIPEVAEAYEQVNETTIDKVEGKLLENINAGNVIAQIFYLKTKAKHRGYVERVEQTGAGGKDLIPKEADDTRAEILRKLDGIAAATGADKVSK